MNDARGPDVWAGWSPAVDGPPAKPIAICTQCANEIEPEDVASGFCWRCGNMGVIEVREEITE